MGGRDHSITCETCGLQRGGLNDYKCVCDGDRVVSVPSQTLQISVIERSQELSRAYVEALELVNGKLPIETVRLVRMAYEEAYNRSHAEVQ